MGPCARARARQRLLRRNSMSLYKDTKMLYAAAAFAAVVALQAAPLAAADVGVWTPADEHQTPTVVPDNYCNIKIPAPDNDKSSGNNEDQMTAQWDDWVDYSPRRGSRRLIVGGGLLPHLLHGVRLVRLIARAGEIDPVVHLRRHLILVVAGRLVVVGRGYFDVAVIVRHDRGSLVFVRRGPNAHVRGRERRGLQGHHGGERRRGVKHLRVFVKAH